MRLSHIRRIILRYRLFTVYVSDKLLYKKEQEDFLGEKARFLYEMGDLAALKEVLYLLESDMYKSQDPSLWGMRALIEEQRGNLDAAFSMMETSKAKLDRIDASHELRARALNDFGRIQLMRGNRTEAYHYYKQAFKEIISDTSIYSRLLHPIASNVIINATLIHVPRIPPPLNYLARINESEGGGMNRFMSVYNTFARV